MEQPTILSFYPLTCHYGGKVYVIAFSHCVQEHLKESLCSLSTEEAIQVGRITLQYHTMAYPRHQSCSQAPKPKEFVC